MTRSHLNPGIHRQCILHVCVYYHCTDVLKFDIGKGSLLSALPYLVMSVVLQINGFFVDWLRAKQVLTTTQVCTTKLCVPLLARFLHSSLPKSNEFSAKCTPICINTKRNIYTELIEFLWFQFFFYYTLNYAMYQTTNSSNFYEFCKLLKIVWIIKFKLKQ